MTDTHAAEPAATRFVADRFPADAYNEAFGPEGGLREHWRSVAGALGTLTPEVLDQRQERGRRMRHEDGATFNPFDEPGGRGTPWSLEMIPLPMTAGDWSVLEAGILQRALLFERLLSDIYGPQNLIREKRLPAELVFANPRFLHPCHGIVPAGNRYLTYYAADVYRAADGRFRVLRDYGANPKGLGYALENRIVVSRLFPEPYHETRIHRLAPFFRTFHQSLSARLPDRREDPGIVLLSPGPGSRIYFEHALLSRYLGYPLVEGQDLTVRNGEVFLKKLAGLEPVDAIFRHIGDDSSDPFALRKERGGGVAGLIQAYRQQKVEIVNPIGSGFVDTPVLPVFLPQLCNHLLGADLLLESHPCWWCGDDQGKSHVLNNLNRLTMMSAMGGAQGTPVDGDWAMAIAQAPYRCMAKEKVRPATVPAWQSQGILPRHALLRVFACATGNGFTLMPGALAITAPCVADVLAPVPERQRSKDVWVLSDEPVAPFSLMSSLQTIAEFRRASDLPSRVADHLLWLGRYLERAEGLIRLLRSVYRRLSGEDRLTDLPELPFLLNLLRTKQAIPTAGDAQKTDDPKALPGYRGLMERLHGALYQEANANSVVTTLRRVQEAARQVRDRLSLDSWRVVNRLDEFGEPSSEDPLDLLEKRLFTLSAFSGLAMESMTRGIGWRFLDMGRRVERALHQTKLIAAALPRVCQEASASALEALLEVSDSIMTYRGRYRTAFQLAPVLDLLLMDEDNPKSLAFQCLRLFRHVEHLPRADSRRFASAEERLALQMLTTVRLLDLSGIRCNDAVENGAALAAFLDDMAANLAEFAQHISARYLTRIPATPHFSKLGGDERA